jgi:hypothetical protein
VLGLGAGVGVGVGLGGGTAAAACWGGVWWGQGVMGLGGGLGGSIALLQLKFFSMCRAAHNYSSLCLVMPCHPMPHCVVIRVKCYSMTSHAATVSCCAVPCCAVLCCAVH